MENLKYIIDNTPYDRERHDSVKKLNEASGQIEDLNKRNKNLNLLRLKGMRGNLKLGEGVGRRLYKIRRNGQYGSSYVDIPLLKKRRILRVIDVYGNPLLNGKISEDFVDLITKRFNSKKKYKGSSIETFKLLNELSSMLTNKSSKKFSLSCRLIFYDDTRDLIDHLDLILGSIEAGNNNLKNEAIAVLDELLKIGAINGKGHERIYKSFLN